MQTQTSNQKKQWNAPAIKGELNVKETYGMMMGNFIDMMGNLMMMS